MQPNPALYNDIVNLARLGIWERNLQTGEVFWNATIRHIYEVPENYTPQTFDSVQFYKDLNAARELINQAMITGQVQEGEFEIITRKGNVKWVKAKIKGVFADGKCLSVYGTLEDITEHHNLILKLAEEDEKFHQAFDFAPIGMAIVSTTGEWIRVNKSVCTLFGYEEEEFMNHTFQEFTYPDDLNADLKLMHQLLAGEIETYTLEKRYIRKKGTLIWVQLSVTLVRNGAGTPLYFISQLKDVTDRKKYLDSLIKERKRLDNIIKSTQVGTWEWDITADITYPNQRAANILGYTFQELALKTGAFWRNLIHPDEHLANLKEIQACFKREADYYCCECRMRRKQGNYVWVEIRGKVTRWSEDGRPLEMLGTLADIHQRKTEEHERQKVMKQLGGQNDRLMNFAYIVSHNLLSHSGNINMLLDVLSDSENADAQEQKMLMNMLKVNAINLYNTLRHLSEVVDIQRGRENDLQLLSLKTETHKTVEVFSETIREINAIIEIDIDADIQIAYHQAYMDSILLNLLSNAIKYRHPNRQLHIHIKAKKTTHGVKLTFTDNGLGIDLKLNSEKVFGMYKTFHGNKNARGVGLFMVKTQVEAMGGNISIESEPDAGSTFTVEFS